MKSLEQKTIQQPVLHLSLLEQKILIAEEGKKAITKDFEYAVFKLKETKDIVNKNAVRVTSDWKGKLEEERSKLDETKNMLEEKELEFWNRTGYNPYLIWDGFKLPTPDALTVSASIFLHVCEPFDDTYIHPLDPTATALDPSNINTSLNDMLNDGSTGMSCQLIPRSFVYVIMLSPTAIR